MTRQPAKRPRGQPPRAGSASEQVIRVRVTAAEADAYRALAVRRDRTLSDLIRDLLRDQLERA